MKSMSDKELDDFFKSSLEGFEQKPVAGCWNKIEQQLGNQPVKKTVFPYWLAAASVVMVIGLSVKLYNSEEQTIKLTRADDAPLFTEMADNPVQVISIDKENITEDFDLEKSRKANEENFLAMVAAYKGKDEKKEGRNATKPANGDVFIINNSEKLTEAIAQQEIFERNFSSYNNSKEDDSVKIIDELAPERLAKEEKVLRKEKIKSVGDVVNFLVSRIDKRANKIVYVSKTDESDMEITAINLGLFKYKKEY